MPARVPSWALVLLALVAFQASTEAARAGLDWRRVLLQQASPLAPAAGSGTGNSTQGPITEIVVLGDSYSDAGRRFLSNNGTSPNPQWYWYGRYSNGPTWPEYLQALANGRPYADVNNTFPVTLNTSVPTLSGLILHAPVENGSTVPLRVVPLAIGGSPACEANRRWRPPDSEDRSGTETVPWLDVQIDDFVSISNGTSQEFNLTLGSPEQRLIVVETGGNDYLNQFDNITDAFDLNLELSSLPEEAAGCILAGVQRLLALGERNIMVFTLPAVDRVPQVNILKIAPLVNFITRITDRHNDVLREVIQALRANHTDANLYVYELGNATAQVLDHPKTYNFTDTRNACLQYGSAATNIFGRIPIVGGRIRDAVGRLLGSKIQGKCDNPNQHVWWDRVHPTTALHSLYAEDIAAHLQQYGQRP